MNKEKIEKLKQKAKYYAPEALLIAASVTTVALFVRSVKNAVKVAETTGEVAGFEVIEGAEKAALFAREDTILQRADPDFYFLSVGFPKTED